MLNPNKDILDQGKGKKKTNRTGFSGEMQVTFIYIQEETKKIVCL